MTPLWQFHFGILDGSVPRRLPRPFFSARVINDNALCSSRFHFSWQSTLFQRLLYSPRVHRDLVYVHSLYKTTPNWQHYNNHCIILRGYWTYCQSYHVQCRIKSMVVWFNALEHHFDHIVIDSDYRIQGRIGLYRK